VRGEEQHALDNICGFARLMAHGNSYFLHFRWIHPHSVARGHRCGLDSGHSRPKSVRLTAETKRIPMPILYIIVIVAIAIAVLGAGFADEKRSRQCRRFRSRFQFA